MSQAPEAGGATIGDALGLAAMGEGPFLQRFTTAVLAVATSWRSAIPRDVPQTGAGLRNTLRVDRKASAFLFATARLHLLQRTGKQPFPMVTVGRAPTNDIVLDLDGVSKLHATFVQDAGGNWTVTDAGSTNGTLVADEPLARRATRPITNGETLIFGNEIPAMFFLPRGLYGWLLLNRGVLKAS